MKTKLIFALGLLAITCRLSAQQTCYSFEYQQQQIKADPSLRLKMEAAENFIRSYTPGVSSRTESTIIRIPVVVHILYHQPNENISDAMVNSQIDVLNHCFRKKNPDTSKIPSVFKAFAADCEIEFKLATSDPKQKSTSGIVRKYTPITQWEADDKMKSSAEMGDDAWDPSSYLNIWVCNLDRVMGYSSVFAGPAQKDGIVIGYNLFGAPKGSSNMGKTAVHEIGHWMNLKHLWGDAYCGDDLVDDTPKQAGYNIECPTGVRTSCNNGPYGDMYMNYMDFTSDACIIMFTQGQKARMRAVFASGGLRNAMLSSTGLNPPLINEIPLPEEGPKWLHPQLYPNPATTELTLDLAYDTRWIGKILTITNQQGQMVMQIPVTSKYQKLDIHRLLPGMYFLSAKKEDGVWLREKFIKF